MLFAGRRVKQLAERVEELTKLNRQLQHAVTSSLDMLTALEGSSVYVGNPYKSYQQKVEALSKMYSGEADWGNQIMQSVVNVRTSFTIGSGLKFTPGDDLGEREVEFLQDFIHMNKLDQGAPKQYAREAEIEGKALFQLIADPTWARPNGRLGMVKIQFIPWTKFQYTVYPKGSDYTHYYQVKWTNPPEINAVTRLKAGNVTLEEPEFVYGVFGGRVHDINNTPPVISTSLPQFENLDKALYDLRAINNLFASPTPHLRCEDRQVAQELNAKLSSGSLNWKIGKLLITAKADLDMVGINGTGIQSLLNEIETLIKVISGNTGVPIHFFGFADVLSNRATAENLLESITAATEGARHTWIQIYEELFHKVLDFANLHLPNISAFKQGTLDVDFPLVSAAKMKELVDVWLPLHAQDIIDSETVLSKIPDIDPDEVKARLEEEKAKRIAMLPLTPQQGAVNEDEEEDQDNE